MIRKIILFFIICALVVSGFAQKNKKNSIAIAPKSSYFVMLINGDTIPAAKYCPKDTVLFDFAVLDTNIKDFTYCWEIDSLGKFCDTTPLKLAFPTPASYTVSLDFTFTVNLDTICDTITHVIYVDYIRTNLETTVCQGKDITVPTLNGDVTFTNVQGDCYSPWDTISSGLGCDSLVRWEIKMNPYTKVIDTMPPVYVCQGREIKITTITHGEVTFTDVQRNDQIDDTLTSVSGCDSLVRWLIIMDPYIQVDHSVSSCDSVVWGDIVVRRPVNNKGDYTETVERVFLASDPNFSCDTLVRLTVTIVERGEIIIEFDQDEFCKSDDMNGKIELKTNLTAFDWKYYSRENLNTPDSLWTIIKNTSIDITEPGFYFVYAYMDTSLYDTLRDLRIVATTCAKNADTIVADCPLVIPNVFTPNGDKINDVFGIKKLNPKRENELIIHDRWGKEVFRQKNYKCVYKSDGYHNPENAFDGNSRGGQKLPEGTYYYAFKYDAFPRSKPKTYVGVVVIIR